MSDPSARALVTPESDQIRLRVEGLDFGGWTGITIAPSLESAARAFSFEAFPRWPKEPNPARIRPGQFCQVFVGDDKVLSGFVEHWGSSGSKDSRTLSIKGKSITVDVIDSHARDLMRFKDRDLFQIAEALCAVHGIGVRLDPALRTDPLVTRKFPNFKVSTGETVYAAIERAARSRAVLVTDDEDGVVVLTRAAVKRTHTALVMGENIEEWDVSFDAAQLFTEYTCKGQRVPVDGDAGDSAIRPAGTFAEPLLDFTGRKRIMVITPEGGATIERCTQRAAWEAAARFGQAFKLSYTVPGWRQGNGDLWRHNELVPLIYTVNAIEGEFLISEIQYSIGDDGSRTVFSLAPPEAFEIMAPQKRKTGKGKSGGWSEIAGGAVIPGSGFEPVTQSLIGGP